MSEWLEVGMVVCFGISWPISIIKSYRARTAKGKSVVFLAFITLGYVCGIFSKITSGKITYVLIFYFLNFAMLIIELILYARNSSIDHKCEKTKSNSKLTPN